MRSRAAAILALTILAGSPPARAETRDSAWMRELQAGRAALAADDRAAASAHLRAVDSLVGGHAGAKAALALIATRDGRRDDALHWLHALAATGLARPALVDTAFRRWGGDTEFRAVAARFDSNAVPIVRSSVICSLGDSTLLAEDLAWDAAARRFLVSSIHRRKIVSVDTTGVVRDFVAPGTAGAWGFYGLAVDAPRGLLWASSAAGPESDVNAPADSGRTALIAFRLANAKLARRVELRRTADRQVLGDITVGPDGTVYASESLGGAVYRLQAHADTLETLVRPGSFRSPQEPVLSRDGKTLYVPDYSRGVAAVNLATKSVRWPAKPYTLASGGIDGLTRGGDRLIAVQNGQSPHRVLELSLDSRGDAITEWRVLEQGSPRLGEPNHGVVVGRNFWFIGDSGWDRVSDDGRFDESASGRAPVLLRLPLEALR
jgi:sugar lactone lactonase YvrE